MAIANTPMMEQYLEIKSRHSNEILFFRLGDFYEMFFDDATLASRELEITLTSRDGGQNTRVPMCGVPYHSADNYIAKLIAKGYKVAICEQVEDPKQCKGIVKREVIKVITPGTVLSDTLLTDTNNNYLVLLYEAKETVSLAVTDISTGECFWTQFLGTTRCSELLDQLYHLMPAELLIVGTVESIEEIKEFLSNRIPACSCSILPNDMPDHVEQLPSTHFNENELPKEAGATIALGYLLNYLHQTVKTDLSHINKLSYYDVHDSLTIDATTLRNLEITRNMRDNGKKDTLLSVIDFTNTAMGGRLLKKWLEYPLVKINHIRERQEAIAEFINSLSARAIVQSLSQVYDFERILTRIEVGTANARDLISLKVSLEELPAIKRELSNFSASILKRIYDGIQNHSEIVNLISSAISEDPPVSLRDGGLIKEGYNSELDDLRNISRDSKQWIHNLEAKEREATGIRSLKVGFNKVFGYYIEVTHAHSAAVPDSFIRKQTLANAERYITPELKDFEAKVLGAHEKIISLEYQLFTEIRDTIKTRMKEVQQSARFVSQVDSLISLAEAANRYNYVCPTITNSGQIIIKDGRHPIVERLLKRELFVPNDACLNHIDSELMVITGPNMAGKSTYMRQVALLVLMAQIGSFIPAREASITPVDRIFTRVGASDDLATGQSTFMVEMNEVAHILKYATNRSLIILDEIGRGTSTFDGMSIARAVIEFIIDHIHAKTLFATHYHELIELEDYNQRIKNYSVAVKERGKEVVFLRRIIPGGADKSYGIHVAQLAGLPKKTVERARIILEELEKNQVNSDASLITSSEVAATATPVSLFGSSLTNELLELDVMTITPIEALNILYRLHNQARQEAGRV